MELNEAQKQTLSQWAESGLSLAEIQSKLKDEFGLSLTYMDTRLLLDDLGLKPRDKPAPPPPPKLDKTPEAPGGGMKIELDRLARPGYLVSGTVVFSDGVSSEWFIDQMGRIGLKPSKKDYQPSARDMETFQTELQKVLQKQGF